MLPGGSELLMSPKLPKDFKQYQVCYNRTNENRVVSSEIISNYDHCFNGP